MPRTSKPLTRTRGALVACTDERPSLWLSIVLSEPLEPFSILSTRTFKGSTVSRISMVSIVRIVSIESGVSAESV